MNSAVISSSPSTTSSSVVRVSSSSRGGNDRATASASASASIHFNHHRHVQDEVYLYTQRLNNSAALCIEIGRYDRAISSLEKALQLLKLSVQHRADRDTTSSSFSSSLALQHRVNDKGEEEEEEEEEDNDEEEAFLLSSDEDVDYCQCNQCSLDGCIIYSETTDPKISDAYANISSLSPLNTSDCRTNKKRRISSSSLSSSPLSLSSSPLSLSLSLSLSSSLSSSSSPTACLIDHHQHNRHYSRSDGYIYQRPIRVTPQTILEGHIMDYSTMYRIITFNLALANHLSASASASANGSSVNNDIVSSSSSSSSASLLASSSTSTMKMHTSLQLYEKLLKSSNSNINSERFKMIINSNLCHIYRSMMGVNNNNVSNSTSTSTSTSSTETSYQSCLNNLLSTIMVVVDRDKIVCNGNNAADDDDYDCEYNDENVDGDDNEQEEEESSPSTRKRRREHNSIVALDGFLQNASPLFLQDQCADIA